MKFYSAFLIMRVFKTCAVRDGPMYASLEEVWASLNVWESRDTVPVFRLPGTLHIGKRFAMQASNFVLSS